jgi:hypothetical protein
VVVDPATRGSAEHGFGDLHHLPAVRTSGGVHRRMLQPWMGSTDPWMGSAGLPMDFYFFCFFSLLTEAGIKPPRKRSYYRALSSEAFLLPTSKNKKCPPWKIKDVVV